jgi:hypothetical protein
MTLRQPRTEADTGLVHFLGTNRYSKTLITVNPRTLGALSHA